MVVARSGPIEDEPIAISEDLRIQHHDVTARRLTILIVSAQFPFPPRFGFARRVFHLATHLARAHDVTLLTYGAAGDRAVVERLRPELTVEIVQRDAGAQVRRRVGQAASLVSREPFACRSVVTSEMQRAIDACCARRPFDVVQLESSVLCAFRFPPDVPLLLDEHNLEYEVFERMHQGERSVARRAFNQLEARRVRNFEQRWWRGVAGCAVTSEREEAIVRRIAPATLVATVPNGVDLDEFRPSEVEPEAETVVFNGLLRYRPNLDAACHLVDDVWPRVLAARPNARLFVVGKGDQSDLRRLSAPGVTVTGEVPDVRPYLARAAVVAVPVRMGGGTRLKVVEALAMAKPIVTTTLGCEGVDVTDGRDVSIADGPAATAAAIERLFADPSLRARLGRAGRELAERRYSWEDAGDRLEVLARQVAAVRSPQASAAVRGAPPATSRAL